MKIAFQRFQRIRKKYPLFIQELKNSKGRGLFGSNSRFEEKLVTFVNRAGALPSLKQICAEAQRLGERF